MGRVNIIFGEMIPFIMHINRTHLGVVPGLKDRRQLHREPFGMPNESLRSHSCKACWAKAGGLLPVYDGGMALNKTAFRNVLWEMGIALTVFNVLLKDTRVSLFRRLGGFFSSECLPHLSPVLRHLPSLFFHIVFSLRARSVLEDTALHAPSLGISDTQTPGGGRSTGVTALRSQAGGGGGTLWQWGVKRRRG